MCASVSDSDRLRYKLSSSNTSKMSSKYKHDSGAAKRKKKAEIEEKKRKYPKIDTFLTVSSPENVAAMPSTSRSVDDDEINGENPDF